MLTYKWNGENWCRDEMPALKRLARHILWLGGWEAHGWNAFKHGFTPVSVLRRVTFYSHFADIKTPWGYLVVNWRDRHAYLSHDATPQGAHAWLYGAPPDVVRAADLTGEKYRRWKMPRSA